MFKSKEIYQRSREYALERLAEMLSGYDEATWGKLKETRKNTYRRAASLLYFSWPEFVKEMETLQNADK